MTLRCCIDSWNPPHPQRAFQRTGRMGRKSPAAGWASPLPRRWASDPLRIPGVWQLIRFEV